MTLRGRGGQVRRQARVLAEVSGWSVTRNDDQWSTTLTLRLWDQYQWNGGDAEVRIDLGSRQWVWTGVQLPPLTPVLSITLPGQPAVRSGGAV